LRILILSGILANCAALSVSGSDAIATATPPVVQGYVQCMAIDTNGNRYITGSFNSTADFNPKGGEDSKSPSGSDAFITRYNADGSYRWTKKFGGSGTDAGYAIAVSGSTLYVAGDFSGTASLECGVGSLTSSGDFDGFILAMNATDGAEIWKQKFGGTGEDHPRAISVANGKVFITGFFGSSDAGIGGTGSLAINGGLNVFVAALDATNGGELWKQRLGGNNYDTGLGIVASTTDVYVTGEFGLTADFTGGGIGTVASTGGANAFVLDLSRADGTGKWMKQFGGPSGNDVGRGITFDSGIVYVTGNFEAPMAGLDGASTMTNSGNSNAFVLALNGSDGSEVWEQKFGGSDWDKGRAVAVSGSSVFVTGELPSSNAHVGSNVSTIGTTGNVDVFVIALNTSNGSEIWKQKFGGSFDDYSSMIGVYGADVWTTGQFASGNAGVGGSGPISSSGFNGFLLPLNASSGKSSQVITFGALPSKTIGDLDFDPGATSTSGLLLTYDSSDANVATIVSGKIHIVGTGVTTITASQAGNTNYIAAQVVGRTLNVSGPKLTQSISFGPLQSKTFGDPDFNVSATGGASGNPVTFSVSGPATINATAVTITGAGLVTVRASQAGNATYDDAPDVDQSFIVEKATPSVTWAQPESVLSKTELSSIQLNATANVPGTYEYFPAAGIALHRGDVQKLNVLFTPVDNINFNSAFAHVTVNVLNAAPEIVSQPSVSDDPATTGVAVYFTAAGKDFDADPLGYAWDFGDGTSGSGAVAAHTYSAPGNYTVVLHLSDDHGGLTDAQIALTAVSPVTPPGAADTDGDGFSDALEIASGSSAVNAADTPFGAERGGIMPLPDAKLAIKLNFAKPRNDDIRLSGTVVVEGEVDHTKFVADIGGIAKSYTISNSGLAFDGKSSVSLKTKGTAAQMAKFAIKWVKGDFAGQLAAAGLANASVKKDVEIPVTLIAAGHIYQTVVSASYTAKAGKTGSVKQSR
jgi:hypothetical protein